MVDETIVYLASTALWTRMMAIGTFTSVGVILLTVVFAWLTLVGIRSERRDENSLYLVKLFEKDKP